jgi:hypothetical protein
MSLDMTHTTRLASGINIGYDAEEVRAKGAFLVEGRAMIEELQERFLHHIFRQRSVLRDQISRPHCAHLM